MSEKVWPPIKLTRLYANPQGRGAFVIVAEPLPAAVEAGASEAQMLARRRAEREAIDEEWRRWKAEQ